MTRENDNPLSGVQNIGGCSREGLSGSGSLSWLAVVGCIEARGGMVEICGCLRRSTVVLVIAIGRFFDLVVDRKCDVRDCSTGQRSPAGDVDEVLNIGGALHLLV